MTLPWLDEHGGPSALPPPDRAMTEPNGLLAAGGALSPDWLLHAYRHGIFPWYSRGQPILWWSPDPRCVLRPPEFRLRRSLAKTLRNRGFETRVDSDFAATIDGCAAPRDGESGTWIVPAMRRAYLALHRLGWAHSVETWLDGRLVGGLYGVRIGGMFYGESMFSAERDASKVALARLVGDAARAGIALIDCQMATSHLLSLGAVSVSRREFVAEVARLTTGACVPAPWPAPADAPSSAAESGSAAPPAPFGSPDSGASS
jgi:leucyl/phenylalanyl-tRNA--protein transferase